MGNTNNAPTGQPAALSSMIPIPQGYSWLLPRSTPGSSKRKRSADEDCSVATPAKSLRRGQINQDDSTSAPVEVIDLTSDSPPASPAKKKATPERRMRRYRSAPSNSFVQRLERARTQRMYVVGYTVSGPDDAPKMSFDIVGSTGNIYKTTIGKEPICDCPDSLRGHHCKHIIYVLANVLKAPSHLQYQVALLSSELRDILQNSPLGRENESKEGNNDGKRQPIEGDCPICFMEFQPEKEQIVWCRAACGNNVHKTCFQQWAATQRLQGVRCVLCRSDWETDDSDLNLQELVKNGTMGEEGYINVAEEVGLSGERDSSTYYRRWGSRRSYSYGPRDRRWWDDEEADYYY